MKRFISFLFVLGVSITFIHAQKVETISLHTTNYKRLAVDFQIVEVEDQRDNKKYIGTVQKGLSNKNRPAVLGKSFTKEIKTFLDWTLLKNHQEKEVKMLVHKLWITEKTLAASERGYLELVVEFQEKTDSTYTSLGVYESSPKIRGMDVTKKHGENIRAGFITCLEDFIAGKPSTASLMSGERLDFTQGIPDSLATGFYASFKALVHNQVREEEPEASTNKVNGVVRRYDLRNSKGRRYSEYAYYTGKKLLLNAYLIGAGAKHYLAPATDGRYLVYVDRYSRGAAGVAFGLIGAAASTKTRASVLDTTTGVFLECEESVMRKILLEYQDLLKEYNASKKKPADQITIFQKLNDRLMKADSN